MKYFLLFLLIFNIAFADSDEEERFATRQTVKYLKPTGYDKQTLWSIKLFTKDGVEQLELYKKKQKKPVLKYSAELITQQLMQSQIVKFSGKRYYVTQWSSGAHGEEVLIFDLNLKEPKPVYMYFSSWPTTLKVDKSELIIFGTGDNDPNSREPKPQVIKWNPKMKPMDFSLDSEASQSSKSE